MRMSLMKLRSIPKNKILVYDLEHTALDQPELLQFSAVWADGTLAMDTYVRPTVAKEWPHATEVTHITPEMVAEAPTAEEIRPRIEALLNEAAVIVGYAHWCDFTVLKKNGIVVPPKIVLPRADVAVAFAVVYKKRVKDDGTYNLKKLSTCAAYYGFTGRGWHNSLFDAKATLFAFNAMLDNGDIALSIPKQKKQPVTEEQPQTLSKRKLKSLHWLKKHRKSIRRRLRRKREKEATENKSVLEALEQKGD